MTTQVHGNSFSWPFFNITHIQHFQTSLPQIPIRLLMPIVIWRLRGMLRINICSNVPGHMTKMASRLHIWKKPSNIFRTKRPMTLKLGLRHRILAQVLPDLFKWWPCVDLGHFYVRQSFFLMLLHGWKLIQHIVIYMYFQVCFYSAYPQHSDERYTTIGPLV